MPQGALMILYRGTVAEAFFTLVTICNLTEKDAVGALNMAADNGTFEGFLVEVICNDPNPVDPRFTIYDHGAAR